ncbi:MAG: DUF3800 domain-containing protein [Acidobacteriia bacterium]|nr:DUF3800 domain-containing protein [Terriglobia bacterium]
MSSIVYVDESGDLGWSFSAPYRSGGSSRYLTVAALCVPSNQKHIPKRAIKDLYEKFKWPTTVEKKWQQMTPAERQPSLVSRRQCAPSIRIFIYTS